MQARKWMSALLCLLGTMTVVASNYATQTDVIKPATAARFGLTDAGVRPTQEFVASQAPLRVIGASPDEDNQKKRVVLDSLLFEANGGKWPWTGPQEIGDCGSMGIGTSIDIDIAAQCKADPSIVFRQAYRPWIYSSRVTVGKGQLRGDGLVPSWGFEFVQDKGVLWADEAGVPPYEGSIAKEWGAKGAPKQFFPLAAPYKVRQIARCDSAQDVCNAIAAGYPVPFASMKFGTNRLRLVEGRNVATDNEDWPHMQMFSGYDGTLSNGMRLFRMLNSWGPEAYKVKSQMPGDMPGGCYVTWETVESICKEGMTASLTGTTAFRQREFVPDFSVIGASGPPPVPLMTTQEPVMHPVVSFDGINPDYSIVGTLIGLGLLLAGIVLALVGNGRLPRRRSRMFLGTLLVLLTTSIVRADGPDFGSLVTVANGATLPPKFSSVSKLNLATEADPAIDWGAVSRIAADTATVELDFSAIVQAATAPTFTQSAPTTDETCSCGCYEACCKCRSRLDAAARKPTLPTMWSPTWCQKCPEHAKRLEGLVAVIQADPPIQTAVPAIQRADGTWWDWDRQGTPTRDSLAAWAGLPKAATTTPSQPAATHTGTEKWFGNYIWSDGYQRPVPEPGKSYPKIGVYPVGMTAPTSGASIMSSPCANGRCK